MRLVKVKRLVLGCAAFLLACGLSVPGGAQEPVDALKKQLRDMQQEMGDLMKRIEDLETKKAEADHVKSVEQSVKSIQESPSILNPSIGLAIDTTFESRPDTDGEFNVRSVELGLSAEIDPYARAYTFINGTGEGVEIEEAAVQTTSLPVNVTAGRFFADFGRLPQFHPHELPFVNTPLSMTRMVGGESLGTGVQWRYLFPTPFYLALSGGVFNEIGHAHGGEGHGHEEEGEEHEEEGEEHDEEGEEHEEEGEEHDEEGEEHEEEGEEHADEGGSRSLEDLTYLGRLHAYFDLSETWNLEVGSSLAHSPRTEMEEDSRRSLMGVDVTLRHRPLVPGFYEGFTVAGEWFVNRQDFHDVGTMTARGGYAYANWDVNPELPGKWSLGLLLDSAPELEDPDHRTLSLSPYITWAPSEFNRLRLQYTQGWDDDEGSSYDGSQVFLQWTTVLGSHTHGFRERR
ncbi:MAG: YbaB/EbfC family nucleoid-associated protein [Deltaproteobacteria bacterium]|nr:YbaB/EbfC family nucleoid-associated protein [Deltaproteobacteria bacterium]